MESKEFQKYFNKKFFPIQENAFECQKPIICLEGIEKCGKSFIAECIILNLLLSHEKALCLFISPTNRQADRHRKSIEAIIKDAGKEKLIIRSVERHLKFVNGSEVLFFGSGEVRSIIGLHAEMPKSAYSLWVIDDASEQEETIPDKFIAGFLGTAADRRKMILSTNPSHVDDWIFRYSKAGQENDEFVQTFLFKAEDNPYYDRQTGKLLTKLSPDLSRREKGEWKDDTQDFINLETLAKATDQSFSKAVLKVEKDFSYCGIWDMRNNLSETAGSLNAFCVVGKKVYPDGSVSYVVPTYSTYDKEPSVYFLQETLRYNNVYGFVEVGIESPQASGLVEAMQNIRLPFCYRVLNPHKSTRDTATETKDNAFVYAREAFMQDWVRIPYDSTDLFEQLKNVRIKVSGNGLIHYSHKGKTRNDIVVAMCWGLLMLKNLAVTGGFNLSQTLIDMENSPTRKSFEALEWGEISTWLADDLNFGFSGKLIDKNYKDY